MSRDYHEEYMNSLIPMVVEQTSKVRELMIYIPFLSLKKKELFLFLPYSVNDNVASFGNCAALFSESENPKRN